jgi:hypothetical protein
MLRIIVIALILYVASNVTGNIGRKDLGTFLALAALVVPKAPSIAF